MKNIDKTKAITFIVVIGMVVFAVGANYHKFIVPKCNVALIQLNGYLGSSRGQMIAGEDVNSLSDEIVQNLILAEENPRIKAILVSIDSTGGNIFAGEEIANALKSLTKPNIAVIRAVGLSAAYLAATGADTIYASKMSSVGDIGITASYLDETAKDAKEGYTYIEITSTKYKDVGNPHKPLTTEEKNSWIESVKEDHETFVAEIAENRNLNVDDVSEMADGTATDGQGALDAGLIDGMGDLVSTIDLISNEIGEKAEICW